MSLLSWCYPSSIQLASTYFLVQEVERIFIKWRDWGKCRKKLFLEPNGCVGKFLSWKNTFELLACASIPHSRILPSHNLKLSEFVTKTSMTYSWSCPREFGLLYLPKRAVELWASFVILLRPFRVCSVASVVQLFSCDFGFLVRTSADWIIFLFRCWLKFFYWGAA